MATAPRSTPQAASDRRESDLARAMARALDSSHYPALILETPAQLIVAASPAAALLLDPTGADVIGRPIQHFTADRASSGDEVFAGGPLNGFEAWRVLRRTGEPDGGVRLWIRSFADQNSSRYVLAILVADEVSRSPARPIGRAEPLAVVGTADAGLIIERISSDADGMFGWAVEDLVGRSLISLIAAHDVPNCLAALSEASASQTGVTLYLDLSGQHGSGDDAVDVSCEVLILPLHPSPSCAFVFLPTHEARPRTHVSNDVSGILARLGRRAEVGDYTAGLTEHDVPGLSRLTARELQILTRLLDGDRAPAIAAELFLTQGTVRNHLASIFSKVGVTSQQQLLTLFRAARRERGIAQR